jgi:transcriptional regulator with PAS, ATPase and Fis domain
MTEIVGVSINIERVKELIFRIANTEVNTIVCGETGVGKDLVVQNLYEMSKRKGKPFIKINCAALPDSLLESEMFGYEKGAFTGASEKKRGKFEQANEGVLFLDEIGDMSLLLQAKLLRVLQDGEFTALGSEKTVKTNVWVIAATNHDLDKEIKNGNFREDLFYRLSTMTVHVEPLRNRPEDIPLMINYYFKKYASKFNDIPLRILNKSTIDKLTDYHWPGNIRELQNVLQRILILNTDENEIDEIISNGYSRTPVKDALPVIDLPSSGCDVEPKTFKMPLKKIKKEAFAKIEKEVICYVMEKTYWHRTKAAKILCISYKTLLTKIRDLGIDANAEPNGQQLKYLKSLGEVNEAFSYDDGLSFNYDSEAVSASL